MKPPRPLNATEDVKEEAREKAEEARLTKFAEEAGRVSALLPSPSTSPLPSTQTQPPEKETLVPPPPNPTTAAALPKTKLDVTDPLPSAPPAKPLSVDPIPPSTAAPEAEADGNKPHAFHLADPPTSSPSPPPAHLAVDLGPLDHSVQSALPPAPLDLKEPGAMLLNAIAPAVQVFQAPPAPAGAGGKGRGERGSPV